MSLADRDERRLMRQRGAGSRDVPNATFEFDFGNRGGREERQLMRQRGAGNRKLSDVDFGFAFPTPTQSRRSTSKTPRAARSANRASQRSTRKSRESSAVSFVREASAEVATGLARPPSETPRYTKTQRSATIIEQSSSKRRRLDDRLAERLVGQALPELGASPGAVYSIAELPDHEGEDGTENQAVSRAVSPAPPSALSNGEDKENQAETSGKAKYIPKRKKRKSIVQKIGKKKSRLSGGSVRESIVSSVDTTQNEESLEIESRDVEDDNVDQNDFIPGPTDESTLEDGGSPMQPTRKRRKRKSVILGPKKKRRSSGNESITHTQSELIEPSIEMGSESGTEGMNNIQDDQDDVSSVEEDTEASLALQLQAEQNYTPYIPKRQLKKQRRRNRMSVSTSPVPLDMVGTEEDGTYIEEEHTPEPPTPAPARKAKAKGRGKSREKDKHERKQKPSGSSFPITTHRMMNLSALPTITEEEDGVQDSDNEENKVSTFSTRSAPNGVDVLAQICRETIETAISKLDTTVTPNAPISRAELKRKRIALETFGANLDQRLFDMSEAVEHRMTLEARLRKSKREKAELQARWIAIRRSRDELAVKTDDIRRRNWESEEKRGRQWEISELAHRTEIEVEKDMDEDEGDGLEFLLRSVSGTVSAKSSGGGILSQVKAFNDRLERLASRLEGR